MPRQNLQGSERSFLIYAFHAGELRLIIGGGEAMIGYLLSSLPAEIRSLGVADLVMEIARI